MQPLRAELVDFHWAQWIAVCARRLRERWPRLSLPTLEEVASELLDDPELAELAPQDAAEHWLGRAK